jgi:hypothetical protein
MIEFQLTAGGHASVIETDGQQIALRSNRSAPPGATLDALFDGLSYKIKVRSCRREPESAESYRIDGRLVNLARAARERLLAGA